MPSGHAKQEEVNLSSQMEQKALWRKRGQSEFWRLGKGPMERDMMLSMQRKRNFTELQLEVSGLGQTLCVSPLFFRTSSLWKKGRVLWLLRNETGYKPRPLSHRVFCLLPTPTFALCLKEGHLGALSFPLRVLDLQTAVPGRESPSAGSDQ